jgi:hypothetical protein
MKKIILGMCIMASLAIVACEEEEPAQATNSCVTCTMTALGSTSTQEICNQGGDAYIDGTFVGNYEGWISLMTEQGYSCQ